MTRRLCVLAAVSAAVGSLVLAPAPAAAMPAAGAAACAYAATSVAVVVDFGDSSAPSAVCVPAESSDSGAALLAKRAEMLGVPAPRFNSSGLLCAIDGYPSDGCGEQTGAKYAYWSYWHGSGGAWSYSSVGPAGSRVHAKSVEGWRFQPEGAGNPSDPAPRGSADPAKTCGPSPSVTTTSAPAPASEADPLGGTVATALTASPSVPPEASTTPASSSAAAPSSAGPASAAVPAPAGSQQAAGSVRVSERERSTPVWGVVTVGSLIAALGVGGAVVARRRRASDP